MNFDAQQTLKWNIFLNVFNIRSILSCIFLY